MSSVERRNIIGGIASLSLSALFSSAAAQERRPFCCYSLSRGWNSRGGRIIATRVAIGDRSGVPEVVKRVQEVLGFSNPIDVLIAKEREDNAMATIAGGRRLLVADVGFLDALNRVTGNNWSAIQVIAHEVGHHVAGFSGEAHSCELNADYWSGQSLQRLGATEDAARGAILAIGNESDTESHPNKYVRADMISSGWHDASIGHIDYSHCQRCKPA